MTDLYLLASSDLYEKGQDEFTAYRKHIGELLTGSKQFKKRKFLLNLTNYRIVLRKKYMYINFIVKTRY